MTYDNPTNSDDIIDVRGVIERFEELETELKDEHIREAEEAGDDNVDDIDSAAFERWLDAAAQTDTHEAQDDAREYKTLREFLNDMKGYGGDHQWQGDWYPVTLIRDSYFEDYAQELASDIGAIKDDASWPYTCIDWEKAARELRVDYTSVEFDGVTYWYR